MANNPLRSGIHLTYTQRAQLIWKLYYIKAIQFGDFTFKSGIQSPMYMDLRLFISYPRFLQQAVEAYADMLTTLEFDRLAGVPYAAMPIVSAISITINRPWIFPRKEVKEYGMGKTVEGAFKKGDRVVLIDDLITKGDSKFESIKQLEDVGLKITDVMVLIDYEKGGSEEIKKRGLGFHTALTMKEVVSTLHEWGYLPKKKFEECINFLESPSSSK